MIPWLIYKRVFPNYVRSNGRGNNGWTRSNERRTNWPKYNGVGTDDQRENKAMKRLRGSILTRQQTALSMTMTPEPDIAIDTDTDTGIGVKVTTMVKNDPAEKNTSETNIAKGRIKNLASQGLCLTQAGNQDLVEGTVINLPTLFHKA